VENPADKEQNYAPIEYMDEQEILLQEHEMV